jgi:hypothetical protein
LINVEKPRCMQRGQTADKPLAFAWSF